MDWVRTKCKPVEFDHPCTLWAGTLLTTEQVEEHRDRLQGRWHQPLAEQVATEAVRPPGMPAMMPPLPEGAPLPVGPPPLPRTPLPRQAPPSAAPPQREGGEAEPPAPPPLAASTPDAKRSGPPGPPSPSSSSSSDWAPARIVEHHWEGWGDVQHRHGDVSSSRDDTQVRCVEGSSAEVSGRAEAPGFSLCLH